MHHVVLHMSLCSGACRYNAISVYDATEADASTPPTLLVALNLLATLPEYSSGTSSKLLPGGIVSTKVLRNGFITASDITGELEKK